MFTRTMFSHGRQRQRNGGCAEPRPPSTEGLLHREDIVFYREGKISPGGRCSGAGARPGRPTYRAGYPGRAPRRAATPAHVSCARPEIPQPGAFAPSASPHGPRCGALAAGLRKACIPPRSASIICPKAGRRRRAKHPPPDCLVNCHRKPLALRSPGARFAAGGPVLLAFVARHPAARKLALRPRRAALRPSSWHRSPSSRR